MAATGRGRGPSIKAGLLIAGLLSALVGVVLWFAAAPLIAAYTDDPAIRAVAGSLVGYVALYQFFDALQTVAGHALRAYRIAFVPMLVQTFCFWGVGLLGGSWLCYRWSPPLGVAGFWLAAVISLVLAAALLLPLLRQAMRASESAAVIMNFAGDNGAGCDKISGRISLLTGRDRRGFRRAAHCSQLN